MGGWETGEYILHLALKEEGRRIKGPGRAGPGHLSAEGEVPGSLRNGGLQLGQGVHGWGWDKGYF